MMSLIPIGTPCRGPRVAARSSSRARRSESSGSMLAQAWTSCSRSPMRSRQARTTASQAVSPAATARAISVAESVFGALVARVSTASVLMASLSVLAGAGGRRAGDAAEHRARSQSRAAGIVEIEQAADQLAGGVEPADRLVVGIEHLG